MVVAADLLARAEPTLVEQLNSQLEEAELAGITHISEVSKRLRNKYMSQAERADMRRVVATFFEQQGVPLECMQEQWETLMKWRAKRIPFAHPLKGADLNINSAKLAELEATVGMDPTLSTVKDAMYVMIQAVEQQLQPNEEST